MKLSSYLFDAVALTFCCFARRSRVVTQVASYLQAVSELIASTPVANFKPYLMFRAAYLLGSDMGTSFLREGLLLGRDLTGVEQQVPREHKCLDATKGALPDDVGRLYVDKVRGPSSCYHGYRPVHLVSGTLISVMSRRCYILVPCLRSNGPLLTS